MKKSILYIGNQLAPRGGTPTGIDTLGPLLETEGYTVYYASARANKIQRFSHMLLEILKKHRRVDYVLIDTYSTTNYWYAVASAVLCTLLKLPYIPILRGGRLPERLRRSPKTLKFLLDKAYVCIAPSQYIMEAFKAAGFNNLKCIPNTIKLEDYTFKPRKTVGPRLFWVRAFAEIYNPLLAIKILEDLLKDYPQASLCMVGPDKDGSMRVCKNYAEAHKLPVQFTGKLNKKAWREASIAYDIFLNTTYYDNMPVSMIEAMALGIPVISTRVGGVSYLARHEKEALLVPANDKKAFITSIELLMKESGKAYQLALEAKARVATFDWNIIKNKWFIILV